MSASAAIVGVACSWWQVGRSMRFGSAPQAHSEGEASVCKCSPASSPASTGPEVTSQAGGMRAKGGAQLRPIAPNATEQRRSTELEYDKAVRLAHGGERRYGMSPHGRIVLGGIVLGGPPLGARRRALCAPAFPSKQLSILWASTGQRPTICNFSHSAAFYATHYFGVLAVTSTSMSIPGHASALMTRNVPAGWVAPAYASARHLPASKK